MTEPPAAPRSAVFGASAMVAASFLRAAVQVAVLPIIGRLLGPQVYGQIALVSPFIFFAMLLAESGLGACLVRAPVVSAELEGTILVFSGTFSLIVIAVFAALAMPLGRLLNAPEFPSLLLGMSGILLLASLNIVPGSLLLRAKRYDWMALSDIVSSVCSLAAIAFGIWRGWGAWSLVAQQVALWLGKVIVVTYAARWRPRLLFSWPLFKENIGFGANLTGASVLSFISRNIDNVLIGSLMGTETLGFYALAFQIVGLPATVLSSSVYYTVFAATSEAQRNGGDIQAPFLKALKGVLLLTAPIMIGIAVTASLSIPLILGEKWLPAILLIILLTPYGMVQTISAATSGVFMGLGKADLVLKLGIIAAFTTIVAIGLGTLSGSVAIACGVSVTALGSGVVFLKTAASASGTTMASIAGTMVAPLISALLMGGAVLLTLAALPAHWPMFLRLMLGISVGVASYGLSLFGLFRDHVAADVAAIRQALLARLPRRAI